MPPRCILRPISTALPIAVHPVRHAPYLSVIAAVQLLVQVVQLRHQGRVHAAGLGEVGVHGDGVEVGQQDGGGAWWLKRDIVDRSSLGLTGPGNTSALVLLVWPLQLSPQARVKHGASPQATAPVVAADALPTTRALHADALQSPT